MCSWMSWRRCARQSAACEQSAGNSPVSWRCTSVVVSLLTYEQLARDLLLGRGGPQPHAVTHRREADSKRLAQARRRPPATRDSTPQHISGRRSGEPGSGFPDWLQRRREPFRTRGQQRMVLPGLGRRTVSDQGPGTPRQSEGDRAQGLRQRSAIAHQQEVGLGRTPQRGSGQIRGKRGP